MALFAVGLYDLCRKVTQDVPRRKRLVVRTTIGCLMIAVVTLDVVMILMNRFHYSVDVVLALWLVFLLYTNGALAIAVEWWASQLWLPVEESRGMICKTCLRKRVEDNDKGEIMIPPCFIPFCMVEGRYYIHHYPRAVGDGGEFSEDYNLLSQDKPAEIGRSKTDPVS